MISSRDIRILMIGGACGGILASAFFGLTTIFTPRITVNISAAARPLARTHLRGKEPAETFALDGCCPVTLIESNTWTHGRPQYREMRGSQTFLFVGKSAQELFQQNPPRYVPAFSGNDIVLATESDLWKPGKREHGLKFKGRIYLFASEESLTRFGREPDSYLARCYCDSLDNEAVEVCAFTQN